MSFRNEPILELRRAPARESLLAALRELDGRLPLEVSILVGADRISPGGRAFASTDRPRCRSLRNDSLAVFSSSRRTRYAMPATMSPTGQ